MAYFWPTFQRICRFLTQSKVSLAFHVCEVAGIWNYFILQIVFVDTKIYSMWVHILQFLKYWSAPWRWTCNTWTMQSTNSTELILMVVAIRKPLNTTKFSPLRGMLTLFKLLLFSLLEFLFEPVNSLPGGWSRARGCAQEERVVWGREAKVFPWLSEFVRICHIFTINGS